MFFWFYFFFINLYILAEKGLFLYGAGLKRSYLGGFYVDLIILLFFSTISASCGSERGCHYCSFTFQLWQVMTSASISQVTEKPLVAFKSTGIFVAEVSCLHRHKFGMNLRQFRMSLGLLVTPWSMIRAMDGHIASEVLVEQLFAHPELNNTHVLALFCVESITLTDHSQDLVKKYLTQATLTDDQLRLAMEVNTLEWIEDNNFRVAMLMKLADRAALDTLLVQKIVRDLSRKIQLENHVQLLEAFKRAVARLEQRPDLKEVSGLIELANRKLALLKLLPPFSCSVRRSIPGAGQDKTRCCIPWGNACFSYACSVL
jgi:hypothetical protein